MCPRGSIIIRKVNKLNLGCGPDIKEGWVNVDRAIADGIEYWDAVWNVVPENWKEHFDFILINHMLCTMWPEHVDIVLSKVHQMLKPGGRLQVIDMDLKKAMYAFLMQDESALPIEGGSLDYKLCMHVSGYGTRLSLFTSIHLGELLARAGFHSICQKNQSEYDLRPRESVIAEGLK